jgi:hypothetical protein
MLRFWRLSEGVGGGMGGAAEMAVPSSFSEASMDGGGDGGEGAYGNYDDFWESDAEGAGEGEEDSSSWAEMLAEEAPAHLTAEEFSSLREQAEDAESFRDVIAELRHMGLNSAADVEARLAAQRAEQEARHYFTEQARQVHAEYQQRVDDGELTVEQATDLFTRDLEIAQLRQQTQAAEWGDYQAAISREVEAAISDKPLLRAQGEPVKQMISAFAMALNLPIPQVVDMFHSVAGGIGAQVASEEAARRAAGPRMVPMAPAGGAPPATGGARGNENSDWMTLLGLRR